VTTAGAAVGTERRGLALTALASLVPFVLLTIWARLSSPAAWELEVLAAIIANADLAGDVLRGLTALGNLVVWAGISLLLTITAVVLGRVWAGVLMALTVASDLAAFAVKSLVERGRPEGALVDVLFGGDSFAFPSGHVVRATSLAAVVAWLVTPPRWRLSAALVAGTLAGIVMGFSRVALGVHWPTDAFGGLLLGILWFSATAWLVAPRGATLRRTVEGP
jgi:undecaprenyl-diphosphatase